jgi:hypothetical protein
LLEEIVDFVCVFLLWSAAFLEIVALVVALDVLYLSQDLFEGAHCLLEGDVGFALELLDGEGDVVALGSHS